MPDPINEMMTPGEATARFPDHDRPADRPEGSNTPTTSVVGARAAGQDSAAAATTITDQAKRTLTGALDGRKSAAADMVAQLAQTVRDSGAKFEGKQDWIASAIGRGAQELGTMADSLRQKDVGVLLGEVQAFAQRRPAVFIGAAVAGGFAIARLGKVVAAELSQDDLPTIPEVGHGRS